MGMKKICMFLAAGVCLELSVFASTAYFKCVKNCFDKNRGEENQQGLIQQCYSSCQNNNNNTNNMPNPQIAYPALYKQVVNCRNNLICSGGYCNICNAWNQGQNPLYMQVNNACDAWSNDSNIVHASNKSKYWLSRYCSCKLSMDTNPKFPYNCEGWAG